MRAAFILVVQQVTFLLSFSQVFRAFVTPPLYAKDNVQ